MSAPKNAKNTAPTAAAATATAATAPAAPDHFEYAIEDNVPLPTKRVGVKGVSAFPFGKLNINQSFFVPVTERSKEPWKTVTSMASRMSRDLYPKHFLTAREKNKDGTDGVRVWRAADATEPLAPPKVRGPRKSKTAEQPAPAAPATDTAGNADPFTNATGAPDQGEM